MEEKLNSIIEYLVTLQEGQKQLQKNQQRLEQGQNRIEEKLDNLELETRSGFRHNKISLDEHKEIFSLVSDQMKILQTEVDYLGGKTGKHDMKLYSLEKRLQAHV